MSAGRLVLTGSLEGIVRQIFDLRRHIDFGVDVIGRLQDRTFIPINIKAIFSYQRHRELVVIK